MNFENLIEGFTVVSGPCMSCINYEKCDYQDIRERIEIMLSQKILSDDVSKILGIAIEEGPLKLTAKCDWYYPSLLG